MSEQDGTQHPTKQQRSRKTSTANQLTDKQAPVTQYPSNDDRKAWKVYWEEQEQPWRIEPEIDEERQRYLAGRRCIKPDIEQGIYPFKDVRLSRADVEWLLATHENGRGPVNWRDEKHRIRNGIDLRGADLRNVNLSSLPLARMRGGLRWTEGFNLSKEHRNFAAVHLEGSNLNAAHLEYASLNWAHLEKADLQWAHLEGARLSWSHLERANLEGAYVEKAHLKNATLADKMYIGPHLADVHWNDTNLTVANWSQVKILGDEYEATQKTHDEKVKDKSTEQAEYEIAVRANRQFSVVLQSQGLNEIATRFSYRAQLLQRKVFWYQRQFGQYLFSLLLDLLAGYGYKPWRSFLAYITVIVMFATAYFIIGRTVGPTLSPISAWVFSMTSFHGRGFFPGSIKLDDPLTVLAAIEAFVGLLIEVTFIATLTQRLFGK